MDKIQEPIGSRDFCLALFEAAPDAIVVADAKGRIVMVNAQAEKMLGYSCDELRGRWIEVLVPERLRAAHVQHRSAYGVAPAVRPMGTELELLARRKDGSEFPAEIALSPLVGDFGRLTIAIVRDVTERRKTEEELRYLSGHDVLTGLSNRHLFEERMSRLAQGRQFPVSIVALDVDSLKQINDHSGHAAGDEMLKRCAVVLIQAFRAEDTIARVGGDEFAVLLPSVGHHGAAAAADRLRRLLAKHNAATSGPALSFSIGVATAQRGQSLPNCLAKADRAMYRDKHSHAAR